MKPPGVAMALAVVASILVAITSITASCAPYEPPGDRPDTPQLLLGQFVDDYGIRYVVTEDVWRQGEETRFEIAEWNEPGRFIIARNGADNPSEAGLWTRIDWVLLESGGEFEWAFCYATYDAVSQTAAREGAASDRETPRTGCNGFPFSRMRRETENAASAQDLAGRIDAYLGAQVEANGIPGLTAAVVKDGEVVYEGAFGVRRLGGGEDLTPDHVFHFASVSKPFVATAIVQLVEQGKLRLDDRVTEHLPYFRLADDRYRSITIRQMLNHTSGMVDVRDYEWDSPQYDEGAAERFVREMATDGMLWAPGGGWRYSNKAFDALGDVIAKVSGVSFEEYVQTHILDPIGMQESSFLYPEIDEDLRTSGHVGTPARPSDVYPYNRRHAPSSTLNSSVSQMVNWMLVNLGRGELNGRRILARESYDLLWTPTTDTSTEGVQVGLSWFLSDYKGHSVVSHSGGDTGFRSHIRLLPDDGIGVVIASNWSGTDVGELANGIVDLVLATTGQAAIRAAPPAVKREARELTLR
ncbi:MAG: serine hydrolase domain-containing protein [Gemmatimonadota bacterium]